MSEQTYDDVAPVTPLKGKQKEDVSMSAQTIAQAEDKSIFEWLQELGTSGALKIKLERKYPREWQGHHIAGFLEEYDEPFDEKDIKQRFGGGKYQVKTFRPNPKGGWTYAGAKSFEIEGDPRLSGALLAETPGAPKTMLKDGDDVALQGKALDHMARAAELSQKRAWELEDENRKKGGGDAELMKLAFDPPAVKMLQQEMMEMRRQMAEKDAQILNLITNANKTPSTPSVIEKTFEHLVAGESGRIDALRAQFDSELRTLRENNRHDVEAERTRLQAELERRDRSHDREISMLRETHGQALKSVEQSYEARLDGFKGRVADLERQLAESKTECAKLRDIKEKGPLDAVEQVAQLKNALEILGPGEQEPASTWERVLQTVMQSPMAQAVASRVENAPPAAPPQVNPEVLKRKRAAQAARAAAQGETAVVSTRKPKPQAPSQGHVIELNPMEVAAAMQFVEQAITNGTDPMAFAVSARSMVPTEIISALRQMGPDAFIQAANPPDGSILYSQRGRNWLRKCVAAMLGMTEDEAPPAEAPEVPTESPPVE
jgi:hypothetical protein